MMLLDAKRIKENIEKRIPDDVLSGRIGGASVLVKQEGEVVYQGCFGRADDERELTEDTIFRLASMTKPITGVAVMKQVEKGLVSLDDTLDKFIPEYGEMEIGRPSGDGIEIVGRAQGRIKIYHLLNHTSGVGCGELGMALSKRLSLKEDYNIADIAKAYSALPISFEPFTAQAYSGTVAFDLLARVVEITSGMPYNEFVEQEITKPLGMADTTFTPSDEQWDRMVRMHDFKDGASSFHPLQKHTFGNFPLTYFCGGAGLVSTVSDYVKFADMLLCEGTSRDGVKILSPETVRFMRTVSVPDSIMQGSQKWAISMRVILEPTYGRLPVGAFGWSGAYGTHFWVDPENRVVAVYMKNSFYDGGSGALTAANFEKDVYL